MNDESLNAPLLRDFLSQLYPQKSVNYIGEGWHSITFETCNTIIRFPKHEFPKQGIENFITEVDICNKLRNHLFFEVPAPVIIHDEVTYVCHQIIPGVVKKDGAVIEQSNELLQDYSKALYQIHSFSDISGIRPLVEPSTILDFDTLRYKLTSTFSINMANKICDYYQSIIQDVSSDKVLLHGDFKVDNIIEDNEGRLKGVIDWCNSGIGEREKEFVFLFNELSFEDFTQLLEYYKFYSGITISIKRVIDLAFVRLVNRYGSIANNEKTTVELKKMVSELLKTT